MLKRTLQEASYLPADLEIIEKPVSPTLRPVSWAICGFLVFVVGWMIFGELDIVVTAGGRVIPDDRTKVVQAPVGGIVSKILVADGDAVAKGQPLLRLDPTRLEASLMQATGQWRSARLAHSMHHLLAEAADADSDLPPQLGESAGLDDILAERIRRQQRLLDTTYQAHRDSLLEVDQQIGTLEQRRRAELRGVADTETLLAASKEQTRRELKTHSDDAAHWRKLLPKVEEERDSFRRLHDQEAVSRLQLNDAEEKFATYQANHLNALNRAQETEARAKTQQEQLRLAGHRHADSAEEISRLIEEHRQRRRRLVSDFRSRNVDAAEQNREAAGQLAQEIVKFREERHAHDILAPEAGVVQELAVHTIGAVLQPTQRLLVIVPEDSVLQVEALVLNKDIGFVQAGQDVAIKVDTFPYTRYGLAHGKILHLSADAVQDERLGLVYVARISLETSTLFGKEGEVRLSPGMSVSAEVNIGTRSVGEYFLGPLLQAGDESLRER